MVKYSSVHTTFQALSDPTRQAIVERLAQVGEAPISALAAGHAMSLPGFLKHVRVLEDAGLVTTEKLGRVRRCRLVPGALDEAQAWIRTHRAFWNAQMDSLDRYLESNPPAEEP
ncbi:MAG: metalloregulator ArsR/SmtB family transcription factor [Longimicrobiales bacterium]